MPHVLYTSPNRFRAETRLEQARAASQHGYVLAQEWHGKL